jgi:hypothetical protein
MEIVVVIFGIAGLVWGILLLRRGGLLAGCLAVMLAGACFSVEFFKIVIGPVPVTADRVLLIVLVGQYLIWRRWGWADPKPLGKPEILLCLFTGMMVVSTFSYDYTFANYQPLSWLILYYLMPFCIYWIARQIELTEKSLLVLFASLTVFGVYLAVTSLMEYFQIWSLVFPPYIATNAATSTAEFVGRARGPFLNPISNGIVLSICLGAALMLWPQFSPLSLWVRVRARSDNSSHQPSPTASLPKGEESIVGINLNRLGQLCLLPIYILFFAAIYATLTRSVWMSGLLTLALVVGLAIPWSWRLPILGVGLLAGVLVISTQWDKLVEFKRDKNLSADKTAESVELRPVLAKIAWNMFLDRPLLGCGYSQYKTQHVNYLSDRSTTLNLEKGRGYIPHNVIFSLLTETGLVGLGMFLAMVALWSLDAWHLWQKKTIPLEFRQQGVLLLVALSAYFLNGLFHDVSAAPMANMTIFFLAGITAGLRPELEK